MKIKTQTIILENGMKVIINHGERYKCNNCKSQVFLAVNPNKKETFIIEVIGLAKWNLHKC